MLELQVLVTICPPLRFLGQTKYGSVSAPAFQTMVDRSMEALADISVGSFTAALGHCARVQIARRRTGLS
jgi:hypothetical protein